MTNNKFSIPNSQFKATASISFWLLPCLLILLILPLAALPADNGVAHRLDGLLGGLCPTGAPGFSVAVMRDGKSVYEKGFGLANLEYDIPVTPQTIYHVASVSKQFTAMAVVLLEEDGKLSLEDDIHKYLPELPDYGHPVTIRQLLQHTSGIRDQWQTLALAGWRLDDIITQEQILRVLFRQKELNFVPGTRHLYSNGGYTLAAEIVKRVSGQPFPDFCKERIFDPLNMAHTHFHLDNRRIVHDRAYSYSKNGSGYQAEPLNYANVGATSLFTTAPDLVRWLDNFRDPKVGGPRAIARQQEQAVLTDGTKIDYALGVSIGSHRGFKTISHGGADAGYRSFVLWFPEQELGVAVLTGLASFDCPGTAFKVADALLEDTAQKDGPKRLKFSHEAGGDTVTGERIAAGSSEPKTSDLEAFPGVYWSDELETQYTIKLKDGKLTAEHIRHGTVDLLPTKLPDQFTTREWFMEQVKFQRDPSGHVTGVTLGGGRLTGILFKRKPE
jgi:CubicO group peptidase (beta-lactamase class C family)